jgi:uncharacterized PurR-regulated membrane protein YhhQ (DUF165 family)
MARPGLIGALTFPAALVASYATALVTFMTIGEMLGVSQAEGAFAMGVAFVWAPLVAILVATLVTILVVRRMRRRAAPSG